MINEALGTTIIREGERLRRAAPHDSGFVLYGPYLSVTAGVYEIDFRIAGTPARSGNPLCATLEVTADFGNIVLATRKVYAADLPVAVKTFSLLVATRHIYTLEFRAWVHGAAEVLLGEEPVWRLVSPVLDRTAEAGGTDADRATRLQGDLRRTLARLRPHALRDHRKVRLGSSTADGGYVCVDDFAGIDIAFSFGINDDISLDLDVADRGPTIYQFDHTVVDPAPAIIA